MILKEKVEMKGHIEVGTEGKVKRSTSKFIHEDAWESGGIALHVC
jgi:hypothetical protein